jgi:hypothetical protein
MKFKEYVSYTFNKGKLDVFEHGRHMISQPFHSETGDPFRDVDQALAWLVKYYPELFVTTE